MPATLRILRSLISGKYRASGALPIPLAEKPNPDPGSAGFGAPSGVGAIYGGIGLLADADAEALGAEQSRP